MAVIVPAEKLPDASRATIALAVFKLVAFDVTVNVDAPEPLYVVDPDSPVPETPIVKVLNVPPNDTPEIVELAKALFGILLNLAFGRVPEVILLAFVVSVVAEVAKPDTAPEAIAIATLAALVILPDASTTNVGT